MSREREADTERFLELLSRELGGMEVALVDLVDGNDELPEKTLSFELPIGMLLVTSVDDVDLEFMRHRIEVLLECFEDTLSRGAIGEGEDFQQMPVERSLEEALADLMGRTGALDVMVIDFDSPVIWASAVAGAMPEHRSCEEESADSAGVVSLFPQPETKRDRQRTLKLLDADSAGVVSLFPQPKTEREGEGETSPRRTLELLDLDKQQTPVSVDSQRLPLPESSRRALEAFRALPENRPLCKGGRPRRVFREAGSGLVARSFADIYALILVFGADFDELGADRTISLALPRIERLVLALPPIDPTPERPRRMMAVLRRIT